MLLEEVEDALQRVREPALARLEDAPLDFREAIEVGGEGLEDVPVEVVQVPAEFLGGPIQRGVVVIRPGRDAAAGLPQDRFPDPAFGRGPVGGEEGEGLAGPQRVSVGDFHETGLILLAEGAERERHGEREPAGIEIRLKFRAEPAVQRESLLDPAGPVAEEFPDGRDAESVLIDVRGDDAGLVHRAGRPPGGVGLQQPRLPEKRVGLLEDHGNLPEAGLLGPAQPLEPVDHLVRPARLLPDPDRERRQRVPRVGSVASEACEGGLHLLDRDVPDRGHGPSKARTW